MTSRARARTAAYSALPLALAAGVAGTAAHAATTPDASAAAATPFTVADPSLKFGQPLAVSGSAGPGQPVTLEYSARKGRWTSIAKGTTAADGSYTLRGRVTRSGAARVTVASAAPTAGIARTDARRVTVRAALSTGARKRSADVGAATTVKGRLRPAGAGRVVRLQARGTHGHWRTVAKGRTARTGRFAIRYAPTRTGSQSLRVAFRGDRANSSVHRSAGSLDTWRWSFASRYDIYGGAVACGGSLGYNDMTVAHKSLPCGTKVTIKYHGRTAHATVRDRGPYVGGREFDLAGAVARKLHFDGIGSIRVQVGS
jgi:hypothetical protein